MQQGDAFARLRFLNLKVRLSSKNHTRKYERPAKLFRRVTSAHTTGKIISPGNECTYDRQNYFAG
jgi:hypothetical protein